MNNFAAFPAAPGVFGVVGLAVLVLGERRSPIITTTTRTAALRPRRIRNYLPRRAAALIPLGLVTVLGLFALGIPTASPVAYIESQGSVAVHLSANSYLEGVSTTPDGEIIRSVFYLWPGSFYVSRASMSARMPMLRGLLPRLRVPTTPVLPRPVVTS